MARGRHDLDYRARFEMRERPVRKQTALRPFNCDTQSAVLNRGTDGVRTADVSSADGRPQDQMLPRLKRKLWLERVRNRKSHQQGVCGVEMNVGHFQRKEIAGCRARRRDLRRVQ
jgi:hypothetical protein